jgi:hypothetical protein
MNQLFVKWLDYGPEQNLRTYLRTQNYLAPNHIQFTMSGILSKLTRNVKKPKYPIRRKACPNTNRLDYREYVGET